MPAPRGRAHARPLGAAQRSRWTFAPGNAADAIPVKSFVPPSLSYILARAETLRAYHGDWPALVAKQGLKLRGLADPLEVPDKLSHEYGREISPALRPYRLVLVPVLEVYAGEGRFDRAAGEMERLRLRVGAFPRFAAEASEAVLLEDDDRVRWAERLIADGARDAARREVDRAARRSAP